MTSMADVMGSAWKVASRRLRDTAVTASPWSMEKATVVA